MHCDICKRSDEECRIRKIKDMFLCPKHVTQWYRYGCFDDNTIYQPNEFILHNDYAEIVLKNKDCETVGKAIIDLDDVEKCKEYKWYMRKATNTCYVLGSFPNGKKKFLHRFVLSYDGSDDIDHINRNGLDNRKCNLRIVSHAQNAANNGATGVRLVPSGRYQATIHRNYKSIYLGTYDTYEEAANARRTYANKLQTVN